MTNNLSFDPIRRANITATEMATLFGLNKYSSPAKVLENKRNPTTVVNNHVRRGKLFEAAVLEAFALDAHIASTRHVGGTLRLSEYPISATPDAYSGTEAVVEAKSIMAHTFEAWYDAIPQHYHMQVLTQMLVTARPVGYIGALEAGDPKECEFRFIAWKVDRNEEAFDLMKEEAVRFWELAKKDVLFRVDSKKKSKMIDILKTTSQLICPTTKPEIIKPEIDYEQISNLFA